MPPPTSAESGPAAREQVEVALFTGHVAGVKVRRDFLHLEDVDRRGKKVIQTIEDFLRCETARCLEVGDLGEGMVPRMRVSLSGE